MSSLIAAGACFWNTFLGDTTIQRASLLGAVLPGANILGIQMDADDAKAD